MTAGTRCSRTEDLATEGPDESFEILGRLRLAKVLSENQQAPQLAPQALMGLPGDIVNALAPITEASPAAMLATLLAAFGTMCGPNAHVLVGSKPHYPNIFALVVGASAKARKGTSAAAVRPILEAADDPANPFFPDHQLLGVKSGEALIQAASDMGVGMPGSVGASAGSASARPDQRLLVEEEEYARLLAATASKESILSSTLRSAWDGGTLSNRTRRETLVATNAHIGIIAHVTVDELTGRLATTDVFNGYANRFLHVWSARSGLHPEPGRLPAAVVRRLGSRLADAIAFAQSSGEITRTPQFSTAWDRLYRVIESQPPGGRTYDSLIARGTAHVLRLALAYALLDQSPVLHPHHLEAAAAFWEYCEATVAHIWGASLGDARLDKLATALGRAGGEGLDRAQVTRFFSNNLDQRDLDELTDSLVALGLARKDRRPTGGRPREVLISTSA